MHIFEIAFISNQKDCIKLLGEVAIIPHVYDFLQKMGAAYQDQAKFYDRKGNEVSKEEEARHLLLNTDLINKMGEQIYAHFFPNRQGKQPWKGVDQFGTAAEILRKIRDAYKSGAPSQALYNWAYVPKNKVQELAEEKALPERWYFENSQYHYTILEQYLRYTFFRLQKENKIKEEKDFAVFNTGLVNKYYDNLFAVFTPSDKTSPVKWELHEFCTASGGQYGKRIVGCFNPLPEKANYFLSISDMLYDTNAELSPDWDHIIIDNADRHPLELTKKYFPHFLATNGNIDFNLIRDSIQQDRKVYNGIKNEIQIAIDLAIRRTEWNFKTAIPQYYPTINAMSLLLPLAIVSEDKVDCALVVEKQASGNYIGHTILTLSQAYSNARLVCRPESEWLKPESITTDEKDSSADEGNIEEKE